MAQKQPDGTISLAEANKFTIESNKETEKQMGGAQRAAHRAIDIAFGRGNARGPIREQKPLRSDLAEPRAPEV